MRRHPPTPPQKWTELLRERGLRVTAGRLTALCYLENNPHSSAASVRKALRSEHPALTQQSMHNVVNDLTTAGLLRRIELPGTDSALYETRTQDNHHHVQCVNCRRVEDIDCVVGQAPCMTPDHHHGMRLLEAAVVFRGICADCDAADRDGTGIQRTAHSPAEQAVG